MSTNRTLFEEAIADAKAVKEMAIKNAKTALEESFAPHLQKMLSAKLNEMETEEVTEDIESEENKEINGAIELEKATNEEVDLDELLAELENTESVNEAEESEEETETEIETPESEEETEETIEVKDMSTEDLENYIADVIKDMVAAGEIEAGHEGEEEEKEEGNIEAEEEVNLEEVLKEINALDEAKKKPIKKIEKKIEKKEEKELKEALEAINNLKSELNEVNLLNAKLLYANKIFKAKNLTESQKLKVLSSFDKAKTVTESKLVYETILESLKDTKINKPISENLGSASKAIGKIVDKKPIIEINDAFARMQILAGLK